MNKIEELFSADELDAALELSLEKVEENVKDVEALLYCGKIYQKKGDTRKAMNFFMRVLEVDPDNVVARTSLDMLNSIMGYFCKDMINP